MNSDLDDAPVARLERRPGSDPSAGMSGWRLPVDRARFLSLAAVLAAEPFGCGERPPAPVEVPAVPIVPSDVHEPRTDMPQPPRTEAGFDEPEAKSDTAPADYFDRVGERCDALAPGPTAEAFLGQRNECALFPLIADRPVIEATLKCLAGKSKVQLRHPMVATECFVEAAGVVAKDAKAAARCRTMMAACAPDRVQAAKLSVEGCTSVLSAVHHELRDAAAQCISGCWLASCVGELAFRQHPGSAVKLWHGGPPAR